jgi:tetratricopeptide (TPR) repeat protein
LFAACGILAVWMLLEAGAAAQNNSAQYQQTVVAIQQQIEMGNFDRARTMIAAADNRYPHDGGLANLLGVVEVEQGNNSEAREHFSAAIKCDPKLSSAYMNLSRLDMLTAATDSAMRSEALALSEKAAQLDPRDDEANYQIAMIFVWEEKYPLSLSALKKLSPHAQNQVGAQALLCADRAQLGSRNDADGAAKALAANSDLTEQDADTCLPALLKARRADLIAVIFSASNARQPLSASGLRTLGLAEEASGKLTEARTTLEHAFTADDTKEIVLEDLARIAKAQGDEKGALGYLAHARDMLPDNPSLSYEFGAICLQMGLYGESRKALDDAVKLAPDNPQYNLGLGTVISFSEDPSQALPYLTKYRTLRPQDPAGMFVLGATYFRAKDFDSAVPWLKLATSDANTSADAYFYLGRIARQEGRSDEAVVDLNKSLTARPNHPDVLAELGQISVASGNYAQATSYFGRAIQLESDNYAANFGLLELYARTNDPRREQQSKRFEEIKGRMEQWNRDAMRVLEIQPNAEAHSPN